MNTFKHLVILIVFTGMLFLSTACRRGDDTPDPVDIQVTSVTVSGAKNVSVGQETTYVATVLPDNATNITVTWSVISKGGEASIDNQGVLEATSAGSITVRATASNGLYGEINVAVLTSNIAVSAVSIQGAASFVHGERESYTVDVTPEDATYRTVEWDIVSGSGKIDQNGRLAAKDSGQLTIRVKVDGVIATKTVDVQPYEGGVTSVDVLLNRVDLRNTVLKDYKNEFEALYPMYSVTFETLLDYENNARMRLSGGDYGDVMLIPSSVAARNLSYYYAPIGTLDDVSASWRYVSQKAFEGTVYGLPTYGNVNGILYNKKVFEEAGITSVPATPQAFLDAMETIRAHYTNDSDFIAPFYTNKKDSWPLDQWQGNVSGVSGDPNYYYNELASDRDAFSEGSPHYIVYKLLYDLVAGSLIEDDPSTTNWERSKVEFVKGNIGAMIVGSWAVSQFVDVAIDVRDGTFVYDDGTPGEQSELADPADVGYMPFPYTHGDGHIYSAHSPDFFMGIAKNSGNPAGANDFMLWFLRESGYHMLTGGIPPRTDMPFPDVIESFQELGVILFEEVAATGEMTGKLELVEANSGIVLWNPDWKRDLFEDAFFQRKTYDQIMASLNMSWNAGIDTVF